MANGPNVCKVDEIFISIFIFLKMLMQYKQERKIVETSRVVYSASALDW